MAQVVSQPRPADRASAAAEYRDIHVAACRYRAQGLACSTCSDLAERAARLSGPSAAAAPSPSQCASAAMHLERRDDWRVVRIEGVRYVVVPSGRSGRVYLVRADAGGCACPWYTRTGRQCSHMLALELVAQPAPAGRRAA